MARVIDRIMSRVTDTPGPLDTPCWITNYATDGAGYARLADAGKARRVHVVAYRELVGPVPPELELDHLCRNRGCCNPAHLEPVTHRENVLRGMSPGAVAARTNQCRHGHSLADAIPRRDGTRRCRICRQISNQIRSVRRRARNLAAKGRAA